MFQNLVQAIMDAGGQPYIVGGYVRDQQLHRASKDFDIEVFNLPADQLMEVLSPFGTVNLVGESFGVVKVRTPEGAEFDFSLPRRESKNGRGHTGFLVESDPFMSPKEAASRRDFTFNALMMDPLTEAIHDFYDGLTHLKQRRLVATSEKFVEDPLRVLRGMQFAARFGMWMDTATVDMCRAVSSEFKYLTIERIWGEWYKMVTKGGYIRMAMKVLTDTGWIEHFPVWNRLSHLHNFRTNVVGAERLIFKLEKQAISDIDRAVLVFAALLHGFSDDDADAALAEIGCFSEITNRVVRLVGCWMHNLSIAAIRQQAFKMEPSTIREWLTIEKARGISSGLAEVIEVKAREGGCFEGRLPAILSGKHLIEKGHKPGPKFGTVLATAYEAQMRGEFHDEPGAVAWLESNGALLS